MLFFIIIIFCMLLTFLFFIIACYIPMPHNIAHLRITTEKQFIQNTKLYNVSKYNKTKIINLNQMLCRRFIYLLLFLSFTFVICYVSKAKHSYEREIHIYLSLCSYAYNIIHRADKAFMLLLFTGYM